MRLLKIFVCVLSEVKMKCKTVVCSSVGMKRKINQDNFYVNGHINENQNDYILKSFFSSKSEQVLCVCDGMGGEKNGEIASYIAVKKLLKYKERYSNLMNGFDEHINSFIQSANNALCAYIIENDGELSGTTIALLCVSPEKEEAKASNVGDTKIFLHRSNELKKITVDHNQTQNLVNLNLISEEEARTHKDKSKLTQHLGIFQEEMLIEPYISDTIQIRKNDIFLICSDGLTDMLNYTEISEILNSKASLKKKCIQLIKIANERGGNDNITVILSRIL